MKKVILAMLAACAVSSCSDRQAERAADPVKVKTIVVGELSTPGGQSYTGTIEAESGTALSFSGLGTVESLHVNEGQFVRKGQLVGVLDATSARNAYDAALAAKEQALDARQRMKMLHDAGSLTDIKWVEVETQVRQALASEQIARKGLTDTRLYAPFSGYIAKKNVEAGANVAMGMPVVQLVKIDRVKVKISVPEEEVAHFRQGQTLRVAVAALGGRSFEARITERGVQADPLSRSYEVKALIGNPRHELLPGMLADVQYAEAEPQPTAQVVTLPAGIIQLNDDNRTFVWTVNGGKALKTYVTTGDNVGSRVVITAGLRQGDVVICQGQQKVSTGMEVKTEK